MTHPCKKEKENIPLSTQNKKEKSHIPPPKRKIKS
jgi:hypothetical protein